MTHLSVASSLSLSLHSLSARSTSISPSLRCNLSLTPWLPSWVKQLVDDCGWSPLCGGNGAVCCSVPLWFLPSLSPSAHPCHGLSDESPAQEYLVFTAFAVTFIPLSSSKWGRRVAEKDVGRWEVELGSMKKRCSCVEGAERRFYCVGFIYGVFLTGPFCQNKTN